MTLHLSVFIVVTKLTFHEFQLLKPWRYKDNCLAQIIVAPHTCNELHRPAVTLTPIPTPTLCCTKLRGNFIHSLYMISYHINVHLTQQTVEIQSTYTHIQTQPVWREDVIQLLYTVSAPNDVQSCG